MSALVSYNLDDIPERFFIDVAIGTESFDDVCHTYSLDPEAIRAYEQDVLFNQKLLVAKQAVDDDGTAFRARCRKVVHDSLPQMRDVIHDPDMPGNTRIEAFKTLAKLANLEPKDNSAQTGPALTFTIVAPGGARHETVINMPANDIDWIEA
jgi:hypothetical protein